MLLLFAARPAPRSTSPAGLGVVRVGVGEERRKEKMKCSWMAGSVPQVPYPQGVGCERA